MGLHEKAVLVRVAKNRFVDAVTALLLPVRNFKPEGRFRNAIDIPDKVPALIVKKILTIGDQELQITDLWRIDGWVIHLGHTTVIERVPDAAGS